MNSYTLHLGFASCTKVRTLGGHAEFQLLIYRNSYTEQLPVLHGGTHLILLTYFPAET